MSSAFIAFEMYPFNFVYKTCFNPIPPPHVGCDTRSVFAYKSTVFKISAMKKSKLILFFFFFFFFLVSQFYIIFWNFKLNFIKLFFFFLFFFFFFFQIYFFKNMPLIYVYVKSKKPSYWSLENGDSIPKVGYPDSDIKLHLLVRL